MIEFSGWKHIYGTNGFYVHHESWSCDRNSAKMGFRDGNHIKCTYTGQVLATADEEY